MSDETSTERSALLDDDSDHDLIDPGHRATSHLPLRIGAAMYSFVMMGFFQSSLGVMLQPLSRHYSLSDLLVSLIFIAAPVGYVIGAQSSHHIHCIWGQRGIATMAPTLHILGALAIASHPPFGFVLVGFTAVALGAGLLDSSWCVWGANQRNANTVTGLLQGSFSVGAAAGPFLAGTVLPAWKRPWYNWYLVLTVASVLELCILVFAFRHESSLRYREEKQPANGPADDEVEPGVLPRHLATWLCALYLLAYVGTETAISGWIVTFMIRQRAATDSTASLASSGFWGGMAAGRFALGVVTDRLGVGRATVYYFIIAIAIQSLFAFVHTPIASIVLQVCLGIVMGPMFASGIVSLTGVLPVRQHVPAVSFAVSAGQIGAALLPFGIGAFVEALGIGLYPFAVIILAILALITWVPVLRQQPMGSALESGVDEESEQSDVRTP